MSKLPEADPFQFRDVYSDTWFCTDDKMRETPDYQKVGGPQKKQIGIFYFLWHEKSKKLPLIDHNAAYLEGGLKKVWDMVPAGPLGEPHYWAQPYFGYYRSDDRWIIRKHARMLCNAGIDFIFFDCSNNGIYPHICKAIFNEYAKMESEGMEAPKVIFFLGDRPEFAANLVPTLWDEFYKDNYESSRWFRVEGKPLILGNFSDIPKELAGRFTVRTSWAFHDWTVDGIGKWPWIEEFPQIPGRHPKTKEIEQLSVSCGFHPTSNKGRSFHDGKQPSDGKQDFDFELETAGDGLAYHEEWSRVWELNPPLVMLTGWNEWWAGRWNNVPNLFFADTYTTKPGEDEVTSNYYVDNFNPEFSRDLEPMKGGFRDNYYYQTIQNVRRFKGVRPLPAATGQKRISINGAFSQWEGVGPEYRDSVGDIIQRHADSNVGNLVYTNDSGRNDLKTAKVSCDRFNWYFYIETADEIIRDDEKNWMNLFLNVTQSNDSGWYGYDFVINRFRSGKTVSVEKNAGNGWNWEKVGNARYRLEGNKLHIAVPKSLLPIDEARGFDFKWADHSTLDGDIMEFMDKGDTAPDDRFNYRYTTVKTLPEFSEKNSAALKSGFYMKANSYETLSHGKIEWVDSKNTNVTPVGMNGKLYIPKAFLKKKRLGKIDTLKVTTVGTVAYVAAEDVAKATGKTLIYGPKGTAVLTNRKRVSPELLAEAAELI